MTETGSRRTGKTRWPNGGNLPRNSPNYRQTETSSLSCDSTVPLVRDIRAGDEVELRVWVRVESPLSSLGTGNVDLQIVRTSEPYDNIFSENIRPTAEGRYCSVRGIAQSDFDSDDVVFGANLGYGRQTIQFGPIYINRIGSAE